MLDSSPSSSSLYEYWVSSDGPLDGHITSCELYIILIAVPLTDDPFFIPQSCSPLKKWKEIVNRSTVSIADLLRWSEPRFLQLASFKPERVLIQGHFALNMYISLEADFFQNAEDFMKLGVSGKVVPSFLGNGGKTAIIFMEHPSGLSYEEKRHVQYGWDRYVAVAKVSSK